MQVCSQRLALPGGFVGHAAIRSQGLAWNWGCALGLWAGWQGSYHCCCVQAKSVEDKTKAIEVAVSRVRATLTWLQQHQFLPPRDMIRYENVVSSDLLYVASNSDMTWPTQMDLLKPQ